MSGGLNYIWRVQLAFPGWLACGFGHKPIGIGLFLPQIAWETSGWQGSKHLESHAPRFDLYTFGYLFWLSRLISRENTIRLFASKCTKWKCQDWPLISRKKIRYQSPLIYANYLLIGGYRYVQTKLFK